MNFTSTKPVRVIGLLGIILGLVMALGGVAAYAFTTVQLSSQNITVPASADFLAGARVNNPIAALAQANSINSTSQTLITGMLEDAGLPTDDITFAGLGGVQRAHEPGTPEHDAATNARNMSEQAANLQAGLFTSVLAFGVSILVVGAGALFTINGFALTRIAGRASAAAPAASEERELVNA